MTLGATAALVGEYRWIENALYGLLGSWVTDMPVAAVKLHLDQQSLRHAWHAELWADRLPVLTGADPMSLTVPSATSAALFAALDGFVPVIGPARVDLATGRRGAGRPARRAAPAGRALPGGAAPAGDQLRAPSRRGRPGDRRPGRPGPAAGAQRRDRRLAAGERLVERLVTRPHDVAAVHEFLQRLETAVVGAGARSGLVVLPASVPEE